MNFIKRSNNIAGSRSRRLRARRRREKYCRYLKFLTNLQSYIILFDTGGRGYSHYYTNNNINILSSIYNRLNLRKSWAGAVFSPDNLVYIASHDEAILYGGTTYKLRIMVKFDKTKSMPSLKTIHFNSRLICPSQNGECVRTRTSRYTRVFRYSVCAMIAYIYSYEHVRV